MNNPPHDLGVAHIGLTRAQVCDFSGLKPSTIQNWVKRGFVPHPVNKRYYERHLARILLISSLRGSLHIEKIGSLLTYINGDADDEGDDLISETELYGLFCTLRERIGDKLPAESDLKKTVSEMSSGYDGRIGRALDVMAYAHISALGRKKTEDKLSIILKEN